MLNSFFNKFLRTTLLAAALCLPVSVTYAQSAQEYIEKGNKNYNAKKYEDAVSAYVKAIQAEPKTALKAYLNCARAYSMQKDYVNSQRYYDYYIEVSGDSKDKKISAEYKAVVRKVKNGESYIRPESQARVLVQLQSSMMSGPFLNRQGGGAFAYYDVLMRTGFAEPMIASLQSQLVRGIMNEIESEIMPVEGQPLPNLDRVGWEAIRSKLSKASQFVEAQPEPGSIKRLESTALGWEAYLRGDYSAAAAQFDVACDDSHTLPAAYWGRMMTGFHTDSDEKILKLIEKTESVYKKAEIGRHDAYFALLRAQVYRNQGKFDDAQAQLRIMGEVL